MRTGSELEQHRREAEPLDRGARDGSLGCQLAERGRHEDPDPLILRQDR
jgi:hypothetical protein